MKKIKTGFQFSPILICLMCVSSGWGRPLGINHGIFTICKNPIVVSRENLQKTVASVTIHGKTIRMCALIDEKIFSENQLRSLGWRVIYRIGDVAVLQGSEQSAPYLEALSGIQIVQPHWSIPINTLCMDSARKESNVDQVHGVAPSNLPQSYTGKNVLIGLIDTEFDTHHPAFLTAQHTTRFVAVWDQTDTTDTAHTGFSYGTMKSGQELESDSAFGLNGEFHGTIMASYAAGSQKSPNPPYNYYGVAPDAMIIGAKYSDNTEADVISGLKWMFIVADSLNVPCVVSLSIGLAVGPHDGTSLTDRVIDSLSARPGHIVVGAIGNDGDKMSHISFQLNRGGIMGTWVEAQVDSLKNPPRAQAVSGIDVWADTGKTMSASLYILDKRTLAYKSSNIQLTTQISNSYAPDLVIWNDTVEKKVDSLIVYSWVEHASRLNRKPHMEIFLVSPNSNLILGISFSFLNNATGNIHAWNIEKKAFSSYSINGFYNGDSVSSLNEIGGTAKKIIAVGSYCSKGSITTWNGSIYDRGVNNDSIWGRRCGFSGIGPSIDGRIKPDVCAPGDMVVGAMSRLAAEIGQTVIWPDTLSTNGRYTRGTGTSVSSPIVAGIIALLLQKNPALTSEDVRQLLQSTTIKDQFTGPLSNPNNIWGWGKVNAYGALEQLTGITPGKRIPPDVHGALAALKVIDRGNQKFIYITPGTTKPKSVQILLYSLSGRIVLSKSAIKSTIALPRTLSKGIYLIDLLHDGSSVAQQKLAVW
jgi:subtilisin family serine protease